LIPHEPGVAWRKSWLWRWASPEEHPTSLFFDWVFDDANWAAFQPGRSVRFVRVADESNDWTDRCDRLCERLSYLFRVLMSPLQE
jgi:hypothetical protein